MQCVPKVPWPNHQIWEAGTVLLAGETSQDIQWKKLLWVALQIGFFLSSSLLLLVLSSVGRTVLWLLAEEFSSCYCSWLGFVLRGRTPGGCRVPLPLWLNTVKHGSSYCSAADILCQLEITDCVTPHHPVQCSMSKLAASSRCTNSELWLSKTICLLPMLVMAAESKCACHTPTLSVSMANLLN